MSKSTQEWLDKFDGTGLPYAKVNDLMDTLTHEHGERLFVVNFVKMLTVVKCLLEEWSRRLIIRLVDR